MKVVCDGCRAKYQIPDERVSGRKLKIRCRRCGQAIVVRGDLLAAVAAQELAPPEPAVVEWHVSIDGEQHGPYTFEQMVEMLHLGQLSWGAHVWREGFGDWKLAGESQTLVRSVEELAEGPAPQSAGDEEDGPTRMFDHSEHAEAEGDAFDRGGEVQGDAFDHGPALQPVARTAFASRARRQSRPPGGFAAATVSPAAAFAPSVEDPFTQSPRVSYGQMTGERHEDSVLFSARNLHATTAMSQASPARGGGYASGDGSGLIDIRALASLASVSQRTTTLAGVGPGGNGHHYTPAAAVVPSPAVDERLMGLAHQTGAFANFDSLAPVDGPPAQPNNALPRAILAGSAILAVAGFAAAVVIYRPPEAPPAPVVSAAAAVEPVAPPPAAAPEPVAAEVAEPEEPAANDEAEPAVEERAAAPELANVVAPAPRQNSAPSRPARRAARAQRAAKSEAKGKDAEEAKAKAKAKDKDKDEGGGDPLEDLMRTDKPAAPAAAAPAAAKAEPDPLLDEPAPAKAKPPARDRSIDELLDTAVTGKKAAAPAPAAGAPESPSRADVLKAMRGVEAPVRACGEGKDVKGTASVALTVSGASGRVTAVRVTGIQGDVGSCIARVVRDASFPAFSKPDFKITYPFKFR